MRLLLALATITSLSVSSHCMQAQLLLTTQLLATTRFTPIRLVPATPDLVTSLSTGLDQLALQFPALQMLAAERLLLLPEAQLAFQMVILSESQVPPATTVITLSLVWLLALASISPLPMLLTKRQVGGRNLTKV
jgi:hypothetical protein